MSSATTRSLYRQKGHQWLSSRREYDDPKKYEPKISKGKSVSWIRPTRNNSRSSRPFFPISVAERSFSFLDRVKMFIKPMTQPLLRRSGQLQDEVRKTQGLKDFKIAPCVCNDMRPAAAKLLKCQRLTRLV